MYLEQHTQLKTVAAIFEWHEKNRKSAHRPHLGGSQIGNPCSRALWYMFRWCDSPSFDGRHVRLFETGDLEEDRFVKELRAIGARVWDRDPETGKQIRFTACDGHFALSLDGVVEHIPDAPGKPHVLELKTANEKSFNETKRNGVEKAKPIYFAQVQVGMALSGIHNCLFLMKNKNNDDIYGERIKYDPAMGLQLVAKAEQIIFSDKPPAKLNNDPSFYLCRFCDYRHVCHEGRPPEINCRTCAHSSPERGGDGSWSCAKGLPMRQTCKAHLFNPYAMPWQVNDASPEFVEYVTPDGEVIRNEGNSKEIEKMWIPF